MAQSNGLNPSFAGPVKASNFLTPYGLTLTKTIVSSGVTRIPVFATTVDGSNGFGGTFVGLRITPKDTQVGTVSLRKDEGGTVTTVTIAKSLQGSMNGSAINIPFTLNGCATVETSHDLVNGNIEILFTVAEIV